MAPTRSEIRDVLLSISSSRFAISTEAAIRTSAARAVSASRVANSDSSTSGFTPLRARSAASCHKSFWPWLRSKESIWSSRSLMASVSGSFVALHKRSFQLFDFRFLRSRKLVPSQFLARVFDLLQRVAQLAGGAFGGRGGIIQFMRQPCGKLSQSRQPVALLLHAGGLADPVGHQAHQPLGQFRHFLHQFRKQRRGNFRTRPSVSARPVTPNCFIREKGSTPVTSPGFERNDEGFAADVAARLKLPFKNHEHRVCGIALAASNVSPALRLISSVWLMNQSIDRQADPQTPGRASNSDFSTMTPTPCSNTDG